MLRGRLRNVTWGGLSGWVQDDADLETPVTLTVTVDGVFAGRLVANGLQKKTPKGAVGLRSGFHLRFGPPLSAHVSHLITVERESDGAPLWGSPWLLTPAEALDDAFRAHLARVIAAAPEADDPSETIAFLAGQAARLMRTRAAALSHRQARADHRLFRRRWTPDEGQPQAPDIRPYETRRALYLVATLPQPPAGQALAARLERLALDGFEVSLAAADLETNASAQPFKDHIVTLYARPLCGSIEELLRGERDSFDLICFGDAALARLYGPMAQQLQVRAKLLIAAEPGPSASVDQGSAAEHGREP